MDTANEPATDVMAEMADLLTLFLDLFAADSIGGDDTEDGLAQNLTHYTEQVERVGLAAALCDAPGLQEVCVSYQRVLTSLAASTALSEDVLLALEEWPTLAMVYYESPTETDASLALVEHLQQACWPTPLASTDAEMLLAVLLPAGVPPVEEPAPFSLALLEETPEETPEEALEEVTLSAATVASVETSVTPAEITDIASPVTAPVVAEPWLDPLAETWELRPVGVADAVPAASADTAAPVEEDLAPAEVPLAAVLPLDTLETPMLALADTHETAPEATVLPVETAADDHEVVETWTEAAADDDEPADLEDWDEALDATGEGLLALLCQETTQLAESLADALTADALATDAWRQVLADHSEELERFGEGAVAMGLTGLQQVATHLAVNLTELMTQEAALSAEQCALVCGWTAPVSQYLQDLSEPAAQTALVQYLSDSQWPDPLTDADAVLLLDALQASRLEVEDTEPMPERPREAQWEDISLALPEDVVPELLATLLQELPQQAADFSAAVQRLAAGTGTLADVLVAQRIAHSLKGAANTVGIRGVAMLTHHLEDILLAFSQQEALPTLPLRRTLSNAADCLEAMSEALSGTGTALPAADTLRMVQEVLDWANMIDEDGVPSDDATCPPERDHLAELVDPALVQAEEATPAAPTAVGTSSRLGTELADELLRLSGENLILNGQLQDRLKRAAEHVRAVQEQHAIVQQLVWELAQVVDVRGVTSPLLQSTTAEEFDPLEMEQYNELHTVSRRLQEAVTDALAVGRDVDGSLVTLDGLLHDQHRVQRESAEAIMQARMVPMQTIAPRLQRGVRQACRLTGKEAEFVLHGGDTLVDNVVLTRILDPLMHMLRNAVDHGIEAPEDREARGKPRAGTITLDVTREGNTLILRCRDDGAGLDYASIRRTAVARGLLAADAMVPEEDLGRFILQPGFSTRTHTTQVSGRGIGMDVVYSSIQELKGSLRLSSTAQRGCVMEIRLPVSLMSTHGLLVRSGTQTFAVSDLGLEQILYPAAGSLSQDGETLLYRWGSEELEATTLEALLNLPGTHDTAELTRLPALLVQDDTGRRRVVMVQKVLDSLSIVIKPLGRYIAAIPGVAGATILGDGSATAVLDLPELFRTLQRRQMPASALQETVRLAERPLPLALVVDDSLSARRAMADFVKDLGFEVHTAGDGLEAIARMEQRLPDILLVDLEMPRMNGMELAEHVRVQHSAEALPIIMVTSRSTEKHRRTAARAGVNVYMVKPFLEDALAEHIQRVMASRPLATDAAA